MTNLVAAYQRRDVHDAEKIIKGAWTFAVMMPSLRVSERTLFPQKTKLLSLTTPLYATTSMTFSDRFARSISST